MSKKAAAKASRPAPSSASTPPVKPGIRPIKKLMVANRSEIAIRVMRAATELGLKTVGIYAQEDRFCPHRFKADEAYELNKNKGPLGAYLDIEGIVTLAKEKGVDAIHPGYGFLSENPQFAQACADAGIIFIGPESKILDMMGDKTAARNVARKINVPILEGTDEPVTDRKEAVVIAKKIGFPLIIKAAFGGGGRGMRVVREGKDLEKLLEEAQTEALRSFGNGAVFLEKFVGKAKHIEVQILADKHGNVLHLHERDCSVQRRHQKVIEQAPSYGLKQEVIDGLCEAAVKLAKEVNYTHAGTVEFLVDHETGEWFFIEMNPRIQVEHTVTEEITGIDIVRSQILIAQGYQIHQEPLALPPQDKIEKSGFAIQCRITTEDPENAFTPDFGKILTYRSPGGFGVRLDGALGATNAVITPYYDSMLVKMTVYGRTYQQALDRMDRGLREFRIRGVKTNIPFLMNVVHHEDFKTGQATTRFIDNNPELLKFTARQDRASKLLSYLADTIVNGNPFAKGHKISKAFIGAPIPQWDHRMEPPKGTKQILTEMGPEKFCKDWIAKQKRLLITDTTMRDAHQSLLATRMRTFDMLAVADAVARRTPDLFSLEMWGGATFDVTMRFLREDPWERLRDIREKVPNILLQMLFRGSNAVGYTNYPDNVVKGFIKHAAQNGMDIFRIFDSLNYLPNLTAAMDAVREDTSSICEGTLCYTGDILDPKRDKYDLKYYVRLAKELEKMGAHMLCIKDMAGLVRPYAARKLVKALKDEVGIPIHFHTHDTSGLNAASIIEAAEAGVDVADAAIASMSGGTSQPNLNSIVAALQHTPRDTGLDTDALQEFSDYWATVRAYYKPFDTSEPYGTAEVYLHEMPGGQYTNLKEQAIGMGLGPRWPEIAHAYAEVNQLCGDIVKVTPSSKVVGDLAIECVARGVKPGDIFQLTGTKWSKDVTSMFEGWLGEPFYGMEANKAADSRKKWNSLADAIVGKGGKRIKGRPGTHAAKVNLTEVRAELEQKMKKKPTEDDVWSYLMYPDVFLKFAEFRKTYGDIAALPTPAYYYGVQQKEEINIELEAGKTLFVRLLNMTEPDANGQQTAIFELNGYPRHTTVTNKALAVNAVSKIKADPADPTQVGAPMPGMVASIAVSVGQKVKEGETLVTLEAMKMFAAVSAPTAGTVQEICVKISESVESKDLLVRLGK
ncbi:pyruvate carboxylase [Prosthecobacter fusiformis]|uniref:Pyruvate carboxylase n=1 Tax=Prosthecobacter fusiformis TaxID=48464 RepID=A0A4R7RQY8_9BACT|nr:pyruvate carboxylase [Prosthecobacter fusiformis]TDU67205.1 pyruvate carboxylase [Prosthecobacter fusiformis]